MFEPGSATGTLETASTAVDARRISAMSEGMSGSEILRIAAEIRAMTEGGQRVCNLTVGDFSPAEFRIPKVLENEIADALRRGETNYPPSNGVSPLRESVRRLYEQALGLRYEASSVLVTSGSRPGIYGTFRTIVDPGDRVVFPVPSWNNNHYCYLTGAVPVPVATTRDTTFLPTRELLAPVIRGARLLSLNSPLNPTGTAFTPEALGEICDLVLEENARRRNGERPLYLMYDQVYWMLTFGETRHVDPVSLRPEIAPYTIYVDGVSKAFAATGVRVGWVVGPKDIIDSMNNFMGHVGTWAPRAEQIATARLLDAPDAVSAYRAEITAGLQQRLNALHDGIVAMRAAGLPVDATAPMGAIYLSARFALNGKRTPDGQVLRTNDDIRRYLLEAARFAVVPFQAFGVKEDTGWVRLSVGAVSMADIERGLPLLRQAVESVS
ncbi:MAG TPA: aminotransferase class I/II-fold pyridoxal phosphate-dependent enzyme [Gemmatimonadaceae bacterium]|jgi:aspartate aminotransferase|nr:aminotransferase class I/II-fold pyridoxal phosphate-dependent enzyme [Gemmatimonadaceae bacterium]